MIMAHETSNGRFLAAKGQGAGSLPFEIAVHNGEEDLEEQVDGVYKHRKQEEPRLARHLGGWIGAIFLIE